MMTNDEQYVPDEMDARGCFLDGAAGAFVHEDWEAFLARVRRAAAREALDGLIRDLQEKGRCAAGSSLPDVSDLAEIVWHAQDEARTYRDTHYPTPEETP